MENNDIISERATFYKLLMEFTHDTTPCKEHLLKRHKDTFYAALEKGYIVHYGENKMVSLFIQSLILEKNFAMNNYIGGIKMNMKKLIATMMMFTVLFLCSCNGSNKEYDEHLKNTYNALCEATTILYDTSDIILSAWKYGIYDNKLDFGDNARGLEAVTGISAEKIWSGLLNLQLDGYDIDKNLSSFSDCVLVCKSCMSYDYYWQAKKNINTAKDEIQEVNEDYKGYDEMKKFYSTTLSFYEWLDNPQGNYNQASDTINDYKNELKKYKTELELDYGAES